MAVEIKITRNIIGTGVAYAKKNKKGRELKINLYEMTISDNNESYSLPVARDSQSDRPPCPPNKPGVPYSGKIRNDGELGFRVELYEEYLSDLKDSLIGSGNEVRTEIQIHKGPGHSEGCFLLTDDEAGREKFQKIIKKLDHKNIEIWVND